jgi:hypothetical protein
MPLIMAIDENICFVSKTGKIWFKFYVVDRIKVLVKTGNPKSLSGREWLTMCASELLACTQDIHVFSVPIDTERSILQLSHRYGNPHIPVETTEIYAYDDELLELALEFMVSCTTIDDMRALLKVLRDKYELWRAENPGDRCKPRIVWKWSKTPPPWKNIIVPAKIEEPAAPSDM